MAGPDADIDGNPPTVAIVLGTRPEIIKLAPVIRECQRRGIPFTLIHTGQHYSDSLDTVFFEQLELPRPDRHLGVGSGSHGEQTAEMLRQIEAVVLEETPDVVIVQGDTNSVLAGAVATSKLDATLGHVEAGLRSHDEDMPEEVNRRLTDHASDLLFAPTDQSADNLREEGIDEHVYVTGNTVVDALYSHRDLATNGSEICETLGVSPGQFLLLTAHRAENVDHEAEFEGLLAGAYAVCQDHDLEGVYPIHPRARDRLDAFDLAVPDRIHLVDPIDYLDFIRLQSAAALVLTDSGGVQEEACVLGTPCVTLRDSTERPETLSVGANVLAGTDPDRIRDGADEMLATTGEWANPYGDGTAAEQIVDVIETQKYE